MPKNPQFEAVYKNLALPLTKFVIKRIGGDPEMVDEILSSTMVAGWKGWKTFRHKSSYFTWLCRIALNKIADYYHDQINNRSRFVVPIIDALANIDDKSATPEEALVLKELRMNVNKCLNMLPYEKRRLLWFKYWKDMSYSQIALLMGMSERAVEGKIYRAKHEFAEVWAEKNSSY